MSRSYIDFAQFDADIELGTTGFWCETEEELMTLLDSAEAAGYIWNSGDNLHHFDGQSDYTAPIGIRLHSNRRVTKTCRIDDCNYMISDIITIDMPDLSDDELFGILEV